MCLKALSLARKKGINYVDQTTGVYVRRYKASKGWRKNFATRSNLVLRRKTNNHKLSKQERMPYIRRFLWRVRRMQRSAPAPGEVADPKIGRFAAHQQSNVDQVPMEDEAKDGLRAPLAVAENIS